MLKRNDRVPVHCIGKRVDQLEHSMQGVRNLTAPEFVELHNRLGISRGELCRRIGISPNSGTAYALGRKPIPLTVALACAQIEMENSNG